VMAEGQSTAAEVDDDEALLARARSGDDVALTELLDRYRPLARAKARTWFLVGGDREDVVQEGMIGLYKAVRDYDPSRPGSFHGFAELCVTRQVITAVKSANRHKHGPLNSALSLDRGAEGEDGGEHLLADTLAASNESDPADLVVSAERLRDLRSYLDSVLSGLEVEVLRLHVEGKSHGEIAESLQRQVKAVDNALQRVKKKLDAHLRARALAETS
jgi:RNA polymerase sporulation-specific sigma factor